MVDKLARNARQNVPHFYPNINGVSRIFVRVGGGVQNKK